MNYAKFIIALLLLAGLSVIAAEAAPTFPRLTGRVVDSAGMLDTARERRIGELLEAHENATTNQVVVATLTNLGGYSIETYGYQLGRAWGIGQKGKDNGVVLIVAKKERKVRIEVGYGLEGTLTDAIASNIIHTVMLPPFRRGDFGAGIEQGARAVIQALGGQYTMKPERRRGSSSDTGQVVIPILFILFVIGSMVASAVSSGTRGRGAQGTGHWGGGSWGGGGSSGGGFSGGGGGFGGGGASGGW